jgi:hypothetical protein
MINNFVADKVGYPAFTYIWNQAFTLHWLPEGQYVVEWEYLARSNQYGQLLVHRSIINHLKKAF